VGRERVDSILCLDTKMVFWRNFEGKVIEGGRAGRREGCRIEGSGARHRQLPEVPAYDVYL
jgi:hypothetical protein